MQLLKILQPFILRTNTWVYIEYSVLNQILASLPNTHMEFIMKKNIAKQLSYQNTGGNQKLNVKHSIL